MVLVPLALVGLQKQFLPDSQAIGLPVVVNILQFLVSSQLVKLLIQQEKPIPTLIRSDARVGNPVHELACDCLGVGMAISLTARGWATVTEAISGTS